MTTTVGHYLATRLEQIGLEHYFQVPGDYNLQLLDELLKNDNLKMMSCTNELNAAYAAEGYARANGASACVITFNVGAFSALNGVAGAYAERLPMIFISAGYNTNDEASGRFLHHTIGTTDYSYQEEMFRPVTCKTVRILTAEEAPSLIDDAIATALRESKPCYIEIASNLADAECADPQPRTFERAWEVDYDQEAVERAASEIAEQINAAEKPLLLAGPHLRPYGAIDAFRRVAEAIGCAVAVQPNAKSFFPEGHPQFIGHYLGNSSAPGAEAMVDLADCVLAAGPMFTDYSTVGWTTTVPNESGYIAIAEDGVTTPDTKHTNLPIAAVLETLEAKVQRNTATLDQFSRDDVTGESANYTPAEDSAQLTRAEMVHQINELISADSTLFAETGDSWFNGMHMQLPGGAGFEIEMQWGAIGWSVPSAHGYAVAKGNEHHTILMVGDGSFQLTAQEVCNMIRYEDNITVIVVNNKGYVIESALHEGPYNYYKNWDYAGLVSAFNADDGEGIGITATTAGELRQAFRIASENTRRPVVIEAQIPHDDMTQDLVKWGKPVSAAIGRPPASAQ
ncbi:alpha-keto acid decarboxylase family protein [Corynebacterium lujinxingii]|uniref:Alpha-keto-acid decarboxylase n=1 Tax=Corynebacterium lujinxingii TaxID=2763010 RepID=A0A7H0JXX9_9CORY|nr:thiamine pyrophosphate-binding protein [Corynebacterium lujinxingii]MBC3178414.1 alpha-keto acid decarboxylase family protein [Corynebacterium lujinxingii]NNO11772.1 pyruvate decarboxylase [Corynebacterium lujinxingii]QNP89895.1 alpha-keto acid decarboxylase family protein [Corynebacterium lujinxingii]